MALISPEAFIDVRGPWVPILEEAGWAIRYPREITFTQGHCGDEATVEELQGVSAIIAGGDRLTRRVVEALPDLRVIARAGVGYDRVDVPAATDRGIPVTITPTANHECVAEATLALLFSVAKSIVDNDRRTRQGLWAGNSTRPIRGNTIGLFGLGRIGKSMAVRCRALGMTVLATETYPDMGFVERNDVQLVSFDELLARSDYLSLHCPLNDQTRRMFNRSVFDRMKPGSVLLNTARGGLVHEADLYRALTEGPLSAAGLDVFEVEPVPADNPLLTLSNVALSPHLGGIDSLSLENMAIEAAQCIVRLYRNDWPVGAVVNDELRAGWKW